MLIEMMTNILVMIGALTTGLIIYYTAKALFEKLRKRCKIKYFFCKRHIWELEWLWHNSGEACLKCKKCGKQKKLVISTDSFEKCLELKKEILDGKRRKAKMRLIDADLLIESIQATLNTGKD